MEASPNRAFMLDENDHILAARVRKAKDDESAKAEARVYVDGHDIEIWQARAL